MVAIFALLFGVLVLGYVLFLRADYVPVFSQLRPADASAVVAQLEAKKIPYRLSDGGTTVTVPSDQADMARLAIAGSEVALKGGVGFELFNKSDMGLTDFAQRINYQRALQGELERSIMLLDEVETARVHLAMPERTIFRSERSSAKAAVELMVKPGRSFDDARIAGIQRLVAFAVPDLTPADVVVLGGSGRVLSASGSDDAVLSPEAEEQHSLQGYYRARARAALQQALPGVQAEVRVIALGGPMPVGDTVAPAGGTSGKPARDFRLRVIVATGLRLDDEETSQARGAVIAALALDPAAGDELTFQVGLGGGGSAPATAPLAQVAASPVAANTPPPPAVAVQWVYWLASAIAVVVAFAFALSRLRGTRLSPVERAAMLERVRLALRQTEAQHVDA